MSVEELITQFESVLTENCTTPGTTILIEGREILDGRPISSIGFKVYSPVKSENVPDKVVKSFDKLAAKCGEIKLILTDFVLRIFIPNGYELINSNCFILRRSPQPSVLVTRYFFKLTDRNCGVDC